MSEVKVVTETTTTAEAVPSRPDNWRTVIFVEAIFAVGISLSIWHLVSLGWAIFCLVIAAWESWTIVNAYKEDTISEVIWTLAKRPIVPMLSAVWLGIGIGSGYLGEPRVVARAWAIGLLFGHFFFTPVVESVRKSVRRVRA